LAYRAFILRAVSGDPAWWPRLVGLRLASGIMVYAAIVIKTRSGFEVLPRTLISKMRWEAKVFQ
jgi:hypothetical protein